MSASDTMTGSPARSRRGAGSDRDRDDEIVLRGDAAARAEPVDLLAPLSVLGLEPVGPWAADRADAYESAHRDGFARGLVDGRDEAVRQGLIEARQQTARLVQALETLTEQLDHRAAEQAERSATEAVELALEIAAVILDREVAVAADPGAEAIARCLAVTPHDGELIAHLHPDDVHLLGEVAGLGARSLTVVADDRVRQGDAVVKIDESLVDGRLAGALDRVAEVLR